MSDVITAAVIGAVATIAGIIITNVATVGRMRKSQIEKNTKALEELKEQYESLYSGMGVKPHETLSLTAQHENMKKEILKSYSDIKKKYKKEEQLYGIFTMEQRDLKQTLDNFSRDYMELIGDKQELLREKSELMNEITELQEANAKLAGENQKLRNELYVIQSRDEPEMDR